MRPTFLEEHIIWKYKRVTEVLMITTTVRMVNGIIATHE
jgi:hypothetical protein